MALLRNMEYDEDGNLVPVLGDYLDCGPNGIYYTGVNFLRNLQGPGCVPAVCEENEDTGGYNSAIRVNIFGEAHAPPVGCGSLSTISTSGNAGGIDLGVGSAVNIDILNGLTILNPPASCYPAKVTIFSSASVEVVCPNTAHHVLVNLVGNGTPGQRAEEIYFTTPGPTARLDIPISGRTFDLGVLEPGQASQFTVQMHVTNGPGSNNTMGVFSWFAQHHIVFGSFENIGAA